MKTFPVEDVLVENIVPAKRNANRMEPARYRALVESIKRFGFVQPILLREGFDESERECYEIVDGHHRFDAAKELGAKRVPAVVVGHLEDAQAALEAIGMNRRRGELDLAAVAEEFAELAERWGWKAPDLAASGFSVEEVDDLLQMAQADSTEAALAGAELPAAESNEDEKPKEHLLEVSFASAKDLQRARRVLKKAGAGDLSVGLLSLIDGGA